MRLVISRDGTVHNVEDCFLVEFPPGASSESVNGLLDNLSDSERGEFAASTGLPVAEL